MNYARPIMVIYAIIFSVSSLLAQNSMVLKGDLRVHDPVMIKEDSVYYIFHTGRGISIKSSKGRINWRNAGRVFDSASLPAWRKNDIPEQDGSFWAPDIHYSNGKYHLYY
jgi:arabinan endo-1,5-alpha-L-arabinosidase